MFKIGDTVKIKRGTEFYSGKHFIGEVVEKPADSSWSSSLFEVFVRCDYTDSDDFFNSDPVGRVFGFYEKELRHVH
jgi:hypothetical protein